MTRREETFAAAVHVTASVCGGTPPPHFNNALQTMLARIGPHARNPVWAASQFWALAGSTKSLCVTWTFEPGMAVAARLEPDEAGVAHVAAGGVNIDPCDTDGEEPSVGEPVWALSVGALYQLPYGPRQLLEWIGHSAPGPSTAQAREARNPRQEMSSPPAHSARPPVASPNSINHDPVWDD